MRQAGSALKFSVDLSGIELGQEGAELMAAFFRAHHLKNIETLLLDDCMLDVDGVVLICDALKQPSSLKSPSFPPLIVFVEPLQI